LNEEINLEHHGVRTYSVQTADFVASAKLRFVNHFTLRGAVMVENGIMKPVNPDDCDGFITGENLIHCAICGHYIVEHFTVEDRNTGRQLNIGSDCAEHISVPKAPLITKALKSIKNNVRKDLLDRVRCHQLQDFMIPHIDMLNKKLNEKIDSLLEKNPELFWKPEIKEIEINDVVHKVKRTLFERKQRAYADEQYQRNKWNNIMDNILRWKAKTTKEVIENMLVDESIKELKVPELRQFTKEEKVEVAKEVQRQLSEFMEKHGLVEKSKEVLKQ